MKLKKMLLVISIVIISMFSLMLATSYAWYSFDNAKTTFTAVTNNDIIDVSFQSGEYINTSIAVPITSDQIDKYSDKSNFSIRVKNNKENNDVMVAIKLVDVVIDSQLRKSTFRVDLYHQGSQIISVRGTDIVTAVNETLGSVVLDDDVNNQFEIRVYIIDDGSEQNLMMNKTFSAKISVDVVSRLKTDLTDYSGPDIYVDSIEIDGVSSKSLPTSGYYDMTSSCDKGSVLSWDPLSKIITYESGSYVEDVCSLSFNSSSSYPLLSQMPVGSYVKYTGNNGCDGKHCEGENANYKNDFKMGYCADEAYQFMDNGWRIGYVEDGSTHLISAGSPECMSTSSDGTIYSSNLISSNSLSTENVGTHLENLDNIALKYCNPKYSRGTICDYTTAWSINENDMSKMLGFEFLFSNCFDSKGNSISGSKTCGYFDSVGLIDNGGNYWYNAVKGDNSIFYWKAYGQYISHGTSYHANGVRPVIKLDSSVMVTGGSGTYEDPYTIINYPNTL